MSYRLTGGPTNRSDTSIGKEVIEVTRRTITKPSIEPIKVKYHNRTQIVASLTKQ